MTNLTVYLTQDHAARHRTTLLSVAIGAGLGIATQALGAPLHAAFATCVLGTGAVEIASAFAYKAKPLKRRSRVVRFSNTRRALLRAGFSAAGFLILAGLRIPRVQAAIVERELNRATAGPPPYDKANRIIDFAIKNNIPIRARSIETAKRRIIREYAALPPTTQQSIRLTLAQLVMFEVAASTGESLRIPSAVYFPAGTATFHAPVYVSGALVGDGPGRTIVIVDFDLELRSPGVFVFRQGQEPLGDLAIENLSVVRPRAGSEPQFLLAENVLLQKQLEHAAVLNVSVSGLSQKLDDIFWVNVVFDHCLISYDGGRIYLQSVTFNQCTFIGGNAQAQSTLDSIQAGQSPVTYKNPWPVGR